MKELKLKNTNGIIIKQVPCDYKYQSEFETFDDLSGFINPDIVDNVGIESATQEEIEAYNQQLQLQAIENYKNKWKADGQEYYDMMANRIIMILVGKINAVPMMLEIKKTVNPMLEQIQRGNQSLAMLDYMDGENSPTIPEVVDLFNEIGQYCISYYQTEYPH